MRRSLLLSAALAGVLALGCGDDQHSATAPAADLSAPSLSVDRSTQNFAVAFATEQYLVVLGSTAEALAANCATGAENFDAWTVLTVTRPDGSRKVGFLGKQLHVLIWNRPADFCVESPDFQGTASQTFHDNDFDVNGHGAEASGTTTRGTVSDASGQQYHFVAVLNGTVSPISHSLEQHVEFIRLTPIGR